MLSCKEPAASREKTRCNGDGTCGAEGELEADCAENILPAQGHLIPRPAVGRPPEAARGGAWTDGSRSGAKLPADLHPVSPIYRAPMASAMPVSRQADAGTRTLPLAAWPPFELPDAMPDALPDGASGPRVAVPIFPISVEPDAQEPSADGRGQVHPCHAVVARADVGPHLFAAHVVRGEALAAGSHVHVGAAPRHHELFHAGGGPDGVARNRGYGRNAGIIAQSGVFDADKGAFVVRSSRSRCIAARTGIRPGRTGRRCRCAGW